LGAVRLGRGLRAVARLTRRDGRRSGSDIALVGDQRVSRDHALLRCIRGRWFLSDLGSRHGTRLNGVALQPNAQAPLKPRDLIEIHPWTFQVTDPTTEASAGDRVGTLNDTDRGERASVSVVDQAAGLGTWQVSLLLDCAQRLQSAGDEQALAEVVLEAATRGTGLTNAALLRPTSDWSQIGLVASRGETDAGDVVDRVTGEFGGGGGGGPSFAQGGGVDADPEAIAAFLRP